MKLRRKVPSFSALVVGSKSSITVHLPILVELNESLFFISVHFTRFNIVLDNCVIVINVGFKDALPVDGSVPLSRHGGELLVPSGLSVVFLGGFLIDSLFDIISEHF